jgi:hypothetical protein
VSSAGVLGWGWSYDKVGWQASNGQFDGEFDRGFSKKSVLSAMDFLAAGPVIKECGLAPG